MILMFLTEIVVGDAPESKRVVELLEVKSVNVIKSTDFTVGEKIKVGFNQLLFRDIALIGVLPFTLNDAY